MADSKRLIYYKGTVFPPWPDNYNEWPATKIALDAFSLAYGSLFQETGFTFANLGTSAGKWAGGVIAPNGLIYGIPFNSTAVLKINPTTTTASTFGSLTGTGKWAGGVLAPNGYIYGIPSASTTVLKINPATNTATTFGSLATAVSKWIGGVLASNGCIYSIPYASLNILKKIQPQTRQLRSGVSLVAAIVMVVS
jgi:hypothetical protein